MRKPFLATATILLAMTCVTAPMFAAAPASAAAAVSTTPAGIVARCGQDIPANTTAYLDNDLYCSLTISDGSVLNLNHHSLIGSGAQSGNAIKYVQGSSGYQPNNQSVIENGTITNWDGLFFNGYGPELDLKQMVVSHVGTVFGGLHASLIADQTLFKSDGAVIEGDIIYVNVTRSAFVNNGIGISGYFFGIISVANTLFENNKTAINCNDQSASITGSVFDRNTTAVSLENCIGATIANNTFDRNGTAFKSSLFFECGGCGDPVQQQTQNDQVTGNTFTRNTIAVDAERSTNLVSNRFTRNTVALQSLLPTDLSLAPTISATSNTFERNGNGIDVQNVALLKSNTAVRNTGYGIYAPKAVDLGGNVAYGNGTSPQCTGVVCAGK